jgi:quercetin dioxygenase-like cupin family protein
MKPAVLLAAVVLLSPGLVAAQDAVKIDPKHYKVEFENDQVRVVRVTYAPGEKSPMHSHPNHVFIFLSDGNTRFTLPDGRTLEGAAKAGNVGWASTDLTHAPENIGDKPLELILVETKPRARRN